jgi:hypothetical protein
MPAFFFHHALAAHRTWTTVRPQPRIRWTRSDAGLVMRWR